MADNEKIALDLRNAAKEIYGFTDEELADEVETVEVEPVATIPMVHDFVKWFDYWPDCPAKEKFKSSILDIAKEVEPVDTLLELQLAIDRAMLELNLPKGSTIAYVINHCLDAKAALPSDAEYEQLKADAERLNKIVDDMTETAKDASARAICEHNIIVELSNALHEITTLKSSTMNYGVARVIAENALAKAKTICLEKSKK